MSRTSLSIIIIWLFTNCSPKATSSTNGSSQVRYEVYKIDSLNSYYFIYAKRNDSLFKIVSQKTIWNSGKIIKVGRTYDLALLSSGNFHAGNLLVSCWYFDDSTRVCIDRENGINDFYRTPNLKGLRYVISE
jgi:hypothetical protein